MMLIAALASLSLYLRFASASPTNSSWYPTTHIVTVGPGGLIKYQPEYIVAQAGDIVQFVFESKNHTVTQSTFDSPCSLFKDAGINGFDSGFMPIDPQGDAQVLFLEVVDTSKPLWFYCRQTNHCAVNGMVFAINPPPTGNHSFVNFLANAVANGTVANIPASLTQTGLPPSTISSIPPATATAPSALPPATVTATLTASDGSVGTTTYASYPGQASPTSNPTPVVHNVEVGPGGQLIYSPANITAAIGDIVQFHFNPKNHTVTQSTFAEPCLPISATSGKDGFDSGFMPVDPSDTAQHFFNVTVSSMAPTWVYCKQHAPTGASHCGAGMVFSINAIENGPNNFGAYLANALRINGTIATPQSSSNGGGSPPSSSPPKSGDAAMGVRSNSVVATVVALALVGYTVSIMA